MLCRASRSTCNSLVLGSFLLLVQLLLGSSMASSMKLAGQRVLITGAGRGIGQAIALIFHQEGASVALAARTKHQLEETALLLQQDCSASAQDDASPLPSRVSIHVADVTVSSQVEEMVKEVVGRWGGIDILINNAGRGQATKGLLQDLDPEELLRLLDLNVVAVHRVTSAVLKQAEPRQIINISSKAGKVGLPSMSHYVASKFALEGLTAALAAELEGKNIRVNSISPGMVDTASFPKAPGRPGVRTAESIADGLFVLLESEVTGHYLHVDELDEVRRRGREDRLALKPINERDFRESLPEQKA
jgi:NAD(P)-dependent dehydrogenase (short-subunit alcohol dehydrogenase family)